MKKQIRRVAFVMTACICLLACHKGNENKKSKIIVTTSLDGKPVLVGNQPVSFPLTKNNSELKILISGHGSIKAEDIYVFKKYEEMTGVKTSFRTVAKADRTQEVYKTLTNKTDCDLILRTKLAQNTLMQYGEQGLILDLAKDGLLETYAPNCYAFLKSHPDALASIQSPDGAIYSLPQVNSGAELRVSRKLFVNKLWLQKVNLPLPTTTEEFYQLLKAFRTSDPNGNGDVTDEIPFCSIDWSSVQESFLGSFGLMNRGLHNQMVDFDESTGKVRLFKADDRYKAYLEFFAKLYAEKLLDNFVFTITQEQWNTNIQNDRVGIFASTNLASIPADKADNWVAIEEPLEGPFHDKLWSAVRANFHSTGAAVLPSTCKDPELVLSWLDYFYTDEGTLFYHMGIEGETFEVKDDGSYDYMPALYEDMQKNNLSFDDEIALYSPYPGGSNPTVETAPYFNGGEMAEVAANAARKLFPYGPKEYWPSFTFTSVEANQVSKLESDILKYTQYTRVGFISGLMPFSEWENYKKEIKDMGQDELLSIYQSAVDRYYETYGSR